MLLFLFFTLHFFMQFKTRDIKTQLSSETHNSLPPSLQMHPARPSRLVNLSQRVPGLVPSTWPPSATTRAGCKESTHCGVRLELLGSILQRWAEQSPAHPGRSSRLRHPAQRRHLLGHGCASPPEPEPFMKLPGPDKWQFLFQQTRCSQGVL